MQKWRKIVSAPETALFRNELMSLFKQVTSDIAEGSDTLVII